MNQLSKDLEEQREILRFVQTSCGSLVNRLSQKGDIFQTLMDKTRSVASDQVKLKWQGAALQVARAKRDVERLVQVQGQRIDTINTKIDSQISSIAALNTKVASHRSSIQKQEIRGGSQDLMISQLAKDMGETVQRTEELDRQQTRQQTSQRQEVDILRELVAAQAKTIDEQSKRMAEMSKRMSSLTKSQGGSCLTGGSGLWNGDDIVLGGRDNGPLWLPRK